MKYAKLPEIIEILLAQEIVQLLRYPVSKDPPGHWKIGTAPTHLQRRIMEPIQYSV